MANLELECALGDELLEGQTARPGGRSAECGHSLRRWVCAVAAALTLGLVVGAAASGHRSTPRGSRVAHDAAAVTSGTLAQLDARLQGRQEDAANGTPVDINDANDIESNEETSHVATGPGSRSATLQQSSIEQQVGNSSAGPQEDDERLIHLDLGGEALITVRRSLLLQLPSPALARIASAVPPRGTEALPIFLDYNPQVVLALVDYLRVYRDLRPDERAALPPPSVPAQLELQWQGMVASLGLRDQFPEQVFMGVRTNVSLGELWSWAGGPILRPCVQFNDFWNALVQMSAAAVLIGLRRTGQETLLVATMTDAGSLPRLRGLAGDSKSDPLPHNGVFWWKGGFSAGRAAVRPRVIWDAQQFPQDQVHRVTPYGVERTWYPGNSCSDEQEGLELVVLSRATWPF